MISVKAKTVGFYGGKLRYEEDEFEVENASELGSWMEVLDGEPEEASDPEEDPAPRRRGPRKK